MRLASLLLLVAGAVVFVMSLGEIVSHAYGSFSLNGVAGANRKAG